MALSILDQIGGEEALRGLVNRFYDLIETDPRGATILSMHFRGHGISHVREEQFNFLSGFLGGKRLYLETMTDVLGGVNKIIVDDKGASQGVVPYLPLDMLKPKDAAGATK